MAVSYIPQNIFLEFSFSSYCLVFILIINILEPLTKLKIFKNLNCLIGSTLPVIPHFRSSCGLPIA